MEGTSTARDRFLVPRRGGQIDTSDGVPEGVGLSRIELEPADAIELERGEATRRRAQVRPEAAHVRHIGGYGARDEHFDVGPAGPEPQAKSAVLSAIHVHTMMIARHGGEPEARPGGATEEHRERDHSMIGESATDLSALVAQAR